MDEIKLFTGSSLAGAPHKVLTVDQFFEYMKGREGSTEGVVDTFKAVSWVFRCVYLRANGVSAIPCGVYKISDPEDAEPMDTPFKLKQLMWNIEAGLSLWGAAFHAKEGTRTLKGLNWVNPSTVKIEYDSEGIKHFMQRLKEGRPNTWEPEEMVFNRLFNPTDDLGKGLAPAEVALAAAGIALNIDKWQMAFFKNGAIPAVVLKTKTNLQDEQLSALRVAWERLTRGAERAWRAIALRPNVEPEVIQPPVKDLGMPHLMESVRQQIAVAMGVPQTLLEDAANYATAEAHDKQFTIRTLIPEAEIIKEQLNEQLLNPLKLELRLHPERLEVLQQDEAEKGEYVARVGELVTLALQNDLMDEQEARDRISHLLEFMDLEPLKGPPPEKEEVPEQLDISQDETSEEDEDPPSTTQDIRMSTVVTELRKWQSKAIRRLKEGQSPAVTFESEILDDATRAAIKVRLEGCRSRDDIYKVFDEAMIWGDYPLVAWQRESVNA